MCDPSKKADNHLHTTEENLTLYTQALKAHFPSKEAILQEAQALSSQQSARRKRLIKTSAISSVLAVLITSAWLIDPILQSQHLTTNIGQKMSVQMQDGSTLTLNTQSHLTMENRLFSRHVSLIQGEALFKVAHSWRSFTVHANNTNIRDIGTVFNVRNIQDGAIVTVLEGAVEVSLMHYPDIKPHMLTQQQSLQTHASSLGAPTSVANHSGLAWQHGRLEFDGTPLSIAIAEIQRYRQGKIELADQHAASLRISGAYDITGIESLIDTLPLTLAVSVTRKPDGTATIQSTGH